MNLADVNVLVAALRSDHSQHARCRRWLDEEVNIATRFAVSPLVLSSVTRISTNRRAFAQPSLPADALAFCEALMAAPTAVQVREGPGHWQIFSDLVRGSDAAGNLIPDAWFAALAIEHGCTWVTLDRDFKKFKGLRTAAP